VVPERCALCDCAVHRSGGYAEPTLQGRSHATRHHFVAERFFGRSANRRGENRQRLFERCPWGSEGRSAVYCYECHEELLHNPVFTPADMDLFASLVRSRGLNEDAKTDDRARLAGRIELFHEIIAEGLASLVARNSDGNDNTSVLS
jgi:hypothetical protein